MVSDQVTLAPRKEGRSKSEARADVAAIDETQNGSIATSS